MRLAFAAAAALFAVPPVNAAPPLEAYGRLPGIELLKLSPSGERLALVGVVGDTRRLLLVGADHKVMRAAAVGTAKVRDLAWAGEDHVLLTVSSTVDATLEFGHSYELAAMYQFGLSGAPWQVFHDTNGIEHFVMGYFGAAAADGHWSGYVGGLTETRGGDNNYYLDHGYRDLYRVDLDTGRTRLEAKGSAFDHDWALSPDGSIVAHSEYEKSSGRWRLFAGATQGRVLLTKFSPTREVYLAGLGRSPGTVVVSDTIGDGEHIAEVSTVDGSAAPLFTGTPVTGLIFDRGSLLLLGALERERPGAVLFDQGLQDRYNSAMHAFPGKTVRLASYDRDFHRIVLETQGSRDSGTYWLVDLNTDRAEPLGNPYPDIDGGEVAESRLMRYRAADGLELFGVVTLPPGRAAADLPLIVLPHGGPLGVHDELGFDWWSQAFASRGYVVFQPNYRGSGGPKDDTRVPMEQSEAMASALKRAGKPYEFVTLEHEDHFLSREVTRTAMLKAAVAFVEKYDPPR